MSDEPVSRVPCIGVVAAALGEDIRVAARSARGLGFSGVQLDVRIGGLDLLSLSQSGQRELLSILRGNELELVSLRLDLGAKGIGAGADVDAGLDRIQKVLMAAAGLQCRLVCVDFGPPPVDMAMEELARRADRNGVAIAFRSDLTGFAELEKAVKIGDNPWFLMNLDPVAILRDELSEDEIFSRIGAKIGHVRGRDAILGAEKRTKPVAIGDGSVEWERLLANLEGAAYRGWITVDPMELANRRSAAAAGLDAMRRFLGQPGPQ